MQDKVLYAYSENQIEKIFEKQFNKFFKGITPKSITKEIPEEDRLSQQEAANFVGKTVQTLIAWKKKKKIPFYQIEGTIFYSKSELLEYAKNHPKDFNHL